MSGNIRSQPSHAYPQSWNAKGNRAAPTVAQGDQAVIGNVGTGGGKLLRVLAELLTCGRGRHTPCMVVDVQ